jgi:hypothetical protein
VDTTALRHSLEPLEGSRWRVRFPPCSAGPLALLAVALAGLARPSEALALAEEVEAPTLAALVATVATVATVGAEAAEVALESRVALEGTVAVDTWR